MKQQFSKQFTVIIFILFFTALLIGSGCKDDNTALSGYDEVGSVIDVFELSYQSPKIISLDDKELTVSLVDVKDSVSVDCAVINYRGSKALLSIRSYAYLKINYNKIIKVASKPCGAHYYINDGQDVQSVLDLIDEIKAEPANLKDASYFTSSFISSFGEGAYIDDTHYRLFMAKVAPYYYKQPGATVEDYRFVFILTYD